MFQLDVFALLLKNTFSNKLVLLSGEFSCPITNEKQLQFLKLYQNTAIIENFS